jgi:hypothetical protein
MYVVVFPFNVKVSICKSSLALSSLWCGKSGSVCAINRAGVASILIKSWSSACHVLFHRPISPALLPLLICYVRVSTHVSSRHHFCFSKEGYVYTALLDNGTNFFLFLEIAGLRNVSLTKLEKKRKEKRKQYAFTDLLT